MLTRKIEERQRLDQRPMGLLTPRLHPVEVMELQLLARSATHPIRVYRKPYGPRKATSAAPAHGQLPPASASVQERVVRPEPRPTPKTPMGVQEVLARELFVKWGAELEKTPLKKEISKAFKKLAFKLHPDRCKDPDAGKLFADLTEAYQILKSWAEKAYG